jgi:predicted metal-dependent HD superfamily phosphohydrolase
MAGTKVGMVTPPEPELRRAFRAALGDGAHTEFDALIARHREPLRVYHTSVHVMWVLRDLYEMLGDPSAEVVVAALYHDAVYNPRSASNEADSAALAVSVLRAHGWSVNRCARVTELIMATAGHAASDDAETAALLDADLAILGADPAAYSAYVDGVRREYAHVDDASWRHGRIRVLEGFLDRPRLFNTSTMYARCERRARANITAEIISLEGVATGDDERVV